MSPVASSSSSFPHPHSTYDEHSFLSPLDFLLPGYHPTLGFSQPVSHDQLQFNDKGRMMPFVETQAQRRERVAFLRKREKSRRVSAWIVEASQHPTPPVCHFFLHCKTLCPSLHCLLRNNYWSSRCCCLDDDVVRGQRDRPPCLSSTRTYCRRGRIRVLHDLQCLCLYVQQHPNPQLQLQLVQRFPQFPASTTSFNDLEQHK